MTEYDTFVASWIEVLVAEVEGEFATLLLAIGVSDVDVPRALQAANKINITIDVKQFLMFISFI